MIRRFSLALLCAAACSLLLAASQRPMTLSEMVQLSDEIVVGRVVSNEADWQGKLIVTVSVIEIEETMKGANRSRMQITQLGGTAVHPRTGLSMTMDASTHVTLEPGEDVLLFVSRGAGEIRQIVGAQQGRMSIRTNPQTRLREIPIGARRLEILRGADRDSISAAVPTLDEMRERIRRGIRP